MSEYAPPTGPPPPQVPPGWKAQWNDQYSEWFYVNVYTKKSQWERPTQPAEPPDSSGPPSGPPPSYDHGSSQNVGPDKGSHLGTNNPYGPGASGRPLSSQGNNISEDEALARRLQAEENARAGTSSGQRGSGHSPQPPSSGLSDDYYSGGTSSPFGSHSGYPPPAPQGSSEERGVMSKLFGKNKPQQGQGGYGGPPPGQGYGSPGPGGYGGGYGGPPPQQGYGGGYGGPPPQQQYYGPPGGYGGPPPQQYYQSPPPQQYVQQPQPQKKHGIGMGTAALGVGGALVGGMLLEDAISGGDDGGDDGGGDWGGGDDGGDFGDGGGDF